MHLIKITITSKKLICTIENRKLQELKLKSGVRNTTYHTKCTQIITAKRNDMMARYKYLPN